MVSPYSIFLVFILISITIMILCFIGLHRTAAQILNTEAKGEIIRLSPKVAASTFGDFYFTWYQSTHQGGDIVLTSYPGDTYASYDMTVPHKVIHENTAVNVLPQIAVSENGSVVHLLWFNGSSFYGSIPGDILYIRSTDYGQTFEKVVNMFNQSDCSNLCVDPEPQIAVAGKNVYVAWTDINGGIIFTKSSNDGLSFDHAVYLDQYGFYARIAADQNNVYVAWWRNTPEGVAMFIKTSTDYGRNFGAEKQIRQLVGNGFIPYQWGQITALNPHVYVSWISGNQDDPNKYFIASSDNGTTFDHYIILQSTTTTPQSGLSLRATTNGLEFESTNTTNTPQSGPSLAATQDGFVFIVWQEGNGAGPPEIYIRSSNNFGGTFSNPIDISEDGGYSNSPQIATRGSIPPGLAYIVWSDDTDGSSAIFFRGISQNPSNKWDLGNIDDISSNPMTSVGTQQMNYLVLFAALVSLSISTGFVIKKLRDRRLSKYSSDIKKIYNDTFQDSDLRRHRLQEKKDEIACEANKLSSRHYYLLTQKIDDYLSQITESDEPITKEQMCISKIIDRHRKLMSKYNDILSMINRTRFLTRFKMIGTDPSPLIIDKSSSFSERVQLLANLGILKPIFVFYFMHTLFARLLKVRIAAKEKRFYFRRLMIKPFVNYFVKAHIRKRLAKLHELYSALVTFEYNTSVKSDDDQVKELRNIIGDIQKYVDLLPNPKRLMAGLLGVLAFIASITALIDFLGLRETIGINLRTLINPPHNSTQAIFGSQGSFLPTTEYSSILLNGIIILLAITILAFSVRLINNGFRIKRMLFLSSNSIYPYLDIYLREQHLYDQSVYKLEDELFGSLNAIREKPNEFPEDKIATVVVVGGIIVFFGIYVFASYFQVYFYGLDFNSIILGYVPSIWQMQVLGISLLVLLIISFLFFIIPYIQYQRRKYFRLV